MGQFDAEAIVTVARPSCPALRDHGRDARATTPRKLTHYLGGASLDTFRGCAIILTL